MQDITITIVKRHYAHAQSMFEWATEKKLLANNKKNLKHFTNSQSRYASQVNALEQVLRAIKEELKEQ